MCIRDSIYNLQLVKHLVIVLTLIVCLSAAWTFQPAHETLSATRHQLSHQNIVLIVAHDLSPTLGCYGDSVGVLLATGYCWRIQIGC